MTTWETVLQCGAVAGPVCVAAWLHGVRWALQRARKEHRR